MWMVEELDSEIAFRRWVHAPPVNGGEMAARVAVARRAARSRFARGALATCGRRGNATQVEVGRRLIRVVVRVFFFELTMLRFVGNTHTLHITNEQLRPGGQGGTGESASCAMWPWALRRRRPAAAAKHVSASAGLAFPAPCCQLIILTSFLIAPRRVLQLREGKGSQFYFILSF